MITGTNLKKIIKENQNSDLAHAYRMGLKDANINISKPLDKSVDKDMSILRSLLIRHGGLHPKETECELCKRIWQEMEK